jgi:hypothetical protein
MGCDVLAMHNPQRMFRRDMQWPIGEFRCWTAMQAIVDDHILVLVLWQFVAHVSVRPPPEHSLLSKAILWRTQ